MINEGTLLSFIEGIIIFLINFFFSVIDCGVDSEFPGA